MNQLTHDMLQLGSRDMAVIVLVENLSEQEPSMDIHFVSFERRADTELTLKASRISSSESVSCIFLAIRVMNSAKSIELFPSAST